MRIQKVAVSSLTLKSSIAAAAPDGGQRLLGAQAEIWLADSHLLTQHPRRVIKLLFIVLSIVAVGFWSSSGASAGNPINPGAFTGACGPLPPPSWPTFKGRFDQFTMGLCYQQQQWPHEANRRSSEGLHAPFVKLWYSPQLYRWMTLRSRQGPIPDGSVIIKEEYLDTSPSSPILFWSGMIKDSNLWWDGWDWEVVGTEVTGSASAASSTSASTTSSGACAEPQFSPNGPTAINCIGCHASAVSGSSSNSGNPGAGTFSTPQFVTPATLGNVNATLPFFFPSIQTPAPVSLVAGFTGQLPSSVFANVRMLSASTGAIPCMVPESKDLAASKPFSRNPSVTGPSLFVTSNQCASCHNATDNTPMPTHMLWPDAPPALNTINLSTYGEWRYSMMGLAGRDPIFFAQLDTESTVHSKVKGKFNAPGFIQDTCLGCHGVMGQRQYHLDKGNGSLTLFTRDQLNDPNSKYAALARDGVSCMVCHHMTDEALDDPSTYTGKFKVGPANELYGPYPSGNTDAKIGDNVIRVPMVNSVGITPVFGAQVGEAKLCASCHTIVLPVYDNKGNQIKTEFEQTTYFEWLNSSFASGNQTCQNCHMPDNFKGTKLQYQIANIEDSTFPVVPATGKPTSLPANQLILQERTFYARHQLSGINLFALEMFDQFRTDLGLYATDGLLPDPLRGTYNGQQNAVDGALMQAQSSAQVSFDSLTMNGSQLQADVHVKNLAGHKLPSGVSFRRAFLDFQVLDAQNHVLWESGGTNADGAIVDTLGNLLVTEFFSPTQQTYQPHFWTGNPITSDQQVQIYEELVRDPQGQFTTSFLSLDDKIKDNRIQPQGWASAGPKGDITKPEGTGDDLNYQNGCGCSVVRYQVPLTAVPNAAKVQATLYYQSIPPYYLRQRSEDAHGPDTARLVKFTKELDVSKYTEISDWKLQVATSGAVNLQ
jgi:hypothetical protein